MSTSNDSVRIDKFIWAVRLFKTRALASEACKKGRITMSNMSVKSSRMVKVGDQFELRVPPITRSYKVLGVSEKRMGAKLTPDFIEDITAPDQLEILELSKLAGDMGRPRGLGRPTKRDRRDLEKLENNEWDF